MNDKTINWSQLLIKHLIYNLNLPIKEIVTLLNSDHSTISLIRKGVVKTLKFDKVMNLLYYFKEQNDMDSFNSILSFIINLGQINEFVNINESKN